MVHLAWRDVELTSGHVISTSIQDDEISRLCELAKGSRVLEVGAAYGYSAVSMALAGAECVDSVDPHQWMRSLDTFMDNVRRLDVGSIVTPFVGESQSILSALRDRGERYDLVFIDGDHSRQAVEEDVICARELLNPGGVLACHDYGEDCCCPGVRSALDALYPPGSSFWLVGTLFGVEL